MIDQHSADELQHPADSNAIPGKRSFLRSKLLLGKIDNPTEAQTIGEALQTLTTLQQHHAASHEERLSILKKHSLIDPLIHHSYPKWLTTDRLSIDEDDDDDMLQYDNDCILDVDGDEKDDLSAYDDEDIIDDDDIF